MSRIWWCWLGEWKSDLLSNEYCRNVDLEPKLLHWGSKLQNRFIHVDCHADSAENMEDSLLSISGHYISTSSKYAITDTLVSSVFLVQYPRIKMIWAGHALKWRWYIPPKRLHIHNNPVNHGQHVCDSSLIIIFYY